MAHRYLCVYVRTLTLHPPQMLPCNTQVRTIYGCTHTHTHTHTCHVCLDACGGVPQGRSRGALSATCTYWAAQLQGPDLDLWVVQSIVGM